MALANIADVMDLTGDVYTDSEVWQITSLLEVASREIQLYTGQIFQVTQHVWKPESKSWKYTLPQRPFISLESVQNTDGNAISYTFDGVDTINLSNISLIRFDLDPLAQTTPRLVITYTAGYTVIPADIKAICMSMAMRAFGMKPVDSGLTQESVTSYSYQRGQAGAAGAVGMLPLEQKALKEGYKRPRRAVNMSIGI